MALDAISGMVYGNSAGTSQKNNLTISQDSGAVNLNISEVQAPIKTSGSNSTSDGQGAGQQGRTPNDKQIKEAISRINSKIKERRTRCEFTYHEESKRISIKMIDEATDEVIKEIPPEDTVKMADKLWEMAGMLIDERR